MASNAELLQQAQSNMWNAASMSLSISDSKYSRRLAREMQQKQNEWNEDMWQKTADYNTPKAQRDRLLEAGLNPVGQQLEGGNMSSVPEGASYTDIAPMGIAETMLNAMQGIANVHKTEAEAKTIDAMRDPQKALTQAQTEQFRNQIEVANSTVELNKYTSEWQKRFAEGNLSVAEKQQLISEYNQALQERIANKNFQKTDADIQMLRLQGNKVIAETRNVRQLMRQSKETFEAERPYLGAKARKQAFGEGAYGLYQLPDVIDSLTDRYGKVASNAKNKIKASPFAYTTLKTQFPTVASMLGL